MSVLQKLFHKNGRKSKPFGLFCRKRSVQATPIIELPSKDVKVQDESSVFVAMPPPDVRLVLFQEYGDTSDRKLLFDSKSFELQPQDKIENMCTMSYLQQGPAANNAKPAHAPSKSYQYNYVRGPQDSEILSEMLFGTVGMASRASTLKIHIMKDPHRLMLSRAFCVESAKETGSLDRVMDSQRQPSVLSRRKAKTLPVPTPEPPYIPPPITHSLATSLTSRINRSDSSSSLISLGASILGATGSLGSRSVPQQTPSNHSHSLPPTTRQASRDSFTLTPEPNQGQVSRRIKVKIGFAVIFHPESSSSSEFQRFFFEHFPLIESYVTYLKEQVESALNNFKRVGKMGFIEAMMEALHAFTMQANSVYCTPRLPRPVWSSLTTSNDSQGLPWRGNKQTITWFVSELTRTVDQFNTKQRNFFMSGLITSVLTHHLGWVNTTILPSSDVESQTVAYNPLWAQLGDLYGAVGTPTKVAKTVVVGEIHEIVSTIVSILTYFIRCSDVREVVDVPVDITPQAFSGDHTTLTMKLVPSGLELAEYVYVGVDEEASNLADCAADKELQKSAADTQKEKRRIFCRKNKNSNSMEVAESATDSSATSCGATLCRSRSSPGTSVKPQVNKFIRQISSGNFENLPPIRVRTNSNDMFARPRGVQSRRTSHEVAHSQRLSQSSSALMIQDSDKSESTVSSLEGSKSLCMAVTPDLGQQPENESSGSCPDADVDQTPSFAGRQQIKSTRDFMPLKPRLRTHKRVSSEPFNVNNIKVGDSTNFPIVQETFTGRIEPKVVNVGLDQRSQPVRAMPSPISSPLLARSKSSAGQKGPIMGFKTRGIEILPKLRMKHNSGSCLQESAGKSPLSNFMTPDLEQPGSSLSFESGVRRSISNVSTGGSEVRRSSSGSSGKVKLAARRWKLTESSKTSSIDEEEEGIPSLPPLRRIPSISLEHDEFEQYLDGDSEKDEFIFFTTEKCTNVQNQSSVTQSQPSRTISVEKCDLPPIPSVPPCAARGQSSKAENHSSMATKAPPPLPSVGPWHRSRSVKSESGVEYMTLPTKSAPPLPAVAPVHRGTLYPKLGLTSACNKVPKRSVYPNLTQTPVKAFPSAGVYPKLDAVSERLLYPKLPLPAPSSASTPKEIRNGIEGPVSASNNTEGTDYEKVPLQPVESSDKFEKNPKETDEERTTKPNFGELLADYSPDYLWGFALHGTKPQPNLHENIRRELEHSVARPVLDEPVAEAVSIVADTDKWSVKVLSSQRLHCGNFALPVLNSKLVTEILEKIKKLYQMNVPAEFCMQQLENFLGELVLKSRMLAGYVNGSTRVKMTELSAVLGIESSDLPLLMAIASCHSPQVAAKYL